MANHFTRSFVWMMILLALCSPTSRANAQQRAAAPREIALKIVTVWNTGEFDASNDVLAPSVTLHYRSQNIVLTHDSAMMIVRNWRAAFPDFQFHVEDVITEGDKVVLRIPFTGTHKGPFMGAEPTGKAIAVNEMLIVRVQDGKIVEMWEDYDEYGLRQQLGLIK